MSTLVKIGSVVLEKKNFKSVHVFLIFCIYLPLRKGMTSHLYKLVDWSLRIRLIKVVHVFLLFCNHLPFRKGVANHLTKLESPSLRDALCRLHHFGAVVLEKKMEMSKVYNKTPKTTMLTTSTDIK